MSPFERRGFRLDRAPKLIGSDRRYEKWRWVTFGITWLIYASLYLTRKAFSVAKVAFADDPKVLLQRADYGIIDSAYLTTYAIGQFIWGPLGDRFGARRILLAGMLISILAAVGSGFSTTFIAFASLSVLQGVGQSTGWSNTVKTMSAWFSLRERGRVIGWWCTHYAVGAAVALPFAGWMMEYFGVPRPAGMEGSEIISYWPAGFWSTAGALSGVLVLSWLLLRDRPEDVGLSTIEEYHGETDGDQVTSEPEVRPSNSWWSTIGPILRSRQIWMLAIAYFSIKMTRYAFYFWGPKYISESLGEGVFTSALTAVCLPIGGVFGVIVAGYASDRWFASRRIPVTVLCLLVTAAVMCVGLLEVRQLWLMGTYFFCIGFFLFGPDTIISGTAAMDFGTKARAGTATGFINGVGSIGGILGGYLPGVLTSETDWSQLFYIFIAGLVLSAAILAPLWNVIPSNRQTNE